MHDGMETADIGVVTGSQPWKSKAAVGQDDPGIECAYVPIVQTAYVGNRVFGGCGVVPSDGGTAEHSG